MTAHTVRTEEDRIRETERARLRALVAADMVAAKPLHAEEFQLMVGKPTRPRSYVSFDGGTRRNPEANERTGFY